MKCLLLCDGPVPHPRMNYRGEAFIRLLPGSDNTVYLIAMGVAGARDLRKDITLETHSCGQYTSIAGVRNLPRRLWQVLRIFVAAKRALQKDVDLIRTVSIVPTIVGLLARGRSDVPILANVSDFYSDLYVGGKLPFSRVVSWLIRRCEALCSRVDYLIVDTPAQRARWIDRGVLPTRCVVIPHGLPRSWPSASDAKGTGAPSEIKSHEGRSLFYVGDISEMDGLDVLIRATHLLRARGLPMRLLIIGKGTDAYQRDLLKLTTRLSIEDLVQHVSYVNNGELPAIIDQVTVCVAPFRLRETSSTSIPNKVLEYLTSTKPIVVPSGSALDEIFGPAFYYFTPGDPASLARAIERAVAGQLNGSLLRQRIQHVMQWQLLMDQEWRLIAAILARGVGDARRFDFQLGERLREATGP